MRAVALPLWARFVLVTHRQAEAGCHFRVLVHRWFMLSTFHVMNFAEVPYWRLVWCRQVILNAFLCRQQSPVSRIPSNCKKIY